MNNVQNGPVKLLDVVALLKERPPNGLVKPTTCWTISRRFFPTSSTFGENSADRTVTLTNPSGAVTFPAPGATSGAQRFYRAAWR